MSPEPLAGQDAPPAGTHVHVTPLTMEGKLSVTSAPLAANGPAFVTPIVHESGWPSTAGGPPDRLTARSAARRHSTAPTSQRGP